MEVAIGVALVVLGALGASAAARSAEERGRAVWVPLVVAPMGLLVGAGAALVRDGDLVGSMVAGLVLFALVAAVAQVVRRRRGARSDR